MKLLNHEKLRISLWYLSLNLINKNTQELCDPGQMLQTRAKVVRCSYRCSKNIQNSDVSFLRNCFEMVLMQRTTGKRANISGCIEKVSDLRLNCSGYGGIKSTNNYRLKLIRSLEAYHREALVGWFPQCLIKSRLNQFSAKACKISKTGEICHEISVQIFQVVVRTGMPNRTTTSLGTNAKLP